MLLTAQALKGGPGEDLAIAEKLNLNFSACKLATEQLTEALCGESAVTLP